MSSNEVETPPEAAAVRDALVGRVLLWRSFGPESLNDLSRLLRRVADARRRLPSLLSLWWLVEADGGIPSGDTQAAMLRTLISLFNHCESVTFVVRGDGIKASLLRSVLRSMATGSAHGPRARVVEDLAAARASTEPGLDFTELERAMQALGFGSPADYSRGL